MMWNVIHANKEQTQAIYDKHLKDHTGMFGKKIGPIVSYSYSPCEGLEYVTLKTRSERTINYQFRGNTPNFLEFQIRNTMTRYDVHHATDMPKEMVDILTYYGEKAKKEFLAGSEI